MVRQFVYVHGIAEISLFLRKKYKMRQYGFLFQIQHQNPNLQNNSFYILRILFRMGYKMGQQFLYHPLNGLSLRKSSIKNHNNIISDWVIIRIKHKLGPTKPNKWYQSPWLCGAKVAKVIKVSFVGGVETGCVYLNLFRKWSRERYISPRKPIKPTQMILEKAQQRNIITNGARQ